MTNLVASVFKDMIYNRLLKYNQNWLCLILGGTGSGKSYSALELADLFMNRKLQTTSIRNYVGFNPLQFMEIINSKLIEKGDFIIFDEAGVGMNAREWHSVQNKLLGAILQTFRNLNMGVIFTTPHFSFVDKQARNLFHTIMVAEHIDRKRDLCTLKVLDRDTDPLQDKFRLKYPTFTIEGEKIQMDKIKVKKPHERIIIEYDCLREEYTKALNRKVLAELKQKMQK